MTMNDNGLLRRISILLGSHFHFISRIIFFANIGEILIRGNLLGVEYIRQGNEINEPQYDYTGADIE